MYFNLLVPQEAHDKTSKTDAIVVLTGSKQRIAIGINLLQEGLAPRLLISGVRPGVKLDSILKRNGIQNLPTNISQAIELDHQAYDTFTNGIQTQQWVKSHNINSIRLVTANYHMPRSLLVFSRYMPQLQVIAHPVTYDLDWQDWRHMLAHASMFVKEYMKYTVVFFMRFGSKK